MRGVSCEDPLHAVRVPVLRTERLLLRGWQASDREPFAALNADPRVGEMLGGTLTRAQSDALVDSIVGRWRTHGSSLWAVERAADGELIGAVGLSIPSFAPEPTVEVGWRLAVPAWQHGYATEAARAALRFGFEVLGQDEIVSYTAAINARSRRVMERLGMARRDPSLAYDFLHPRLGEGDPLRPHVTYRLSAATWRQTPAAPRT